jgi:ADP-ribose pyrophosphatase YjhB (NUDIX family)
MFLPYKKKIIIGVGGIAASLLRYPVLGWVPSTSLNAFDLTPNLRHNRRYPLTPSACVFSSSSSVSSTTTASNSNDSQVNCYPRAGVSVAVRCSVNNEPYYLLVQRGKPPNAGKWSFPGGKLEWGETTLEGAKRELAEETKFAGQTNLIWHPAPYATADSIIHKDKNDDGSAQNSSEKNTLFHFLIAICFAELNLEPGNNHPPNVVSFDDAADAKWLSFDKIMSMKADHITPGLIQKVEHAELLYSKGVLL